MKFIINNAIVFHVAERTITDGKKTIRLSNPGTRLLLVLLENQSQQVSRETLLKRIWDDYGMTASGNSLTNNISILRRNFSELGVEGIIETIPKQGVVIRPDELIFNEVAEDYVQTQQAIRQPLTTGSKKWRHALIISSSMLITLCMVIILMKLFKSQDEWKFYKAIQKCQVYYPEGIPASRVNKFFNNPNHVKLLNGCSIDKKIYYDDVRMNSKGGISDVFLLICSLKKNGHLNACRNFVQVEIN